MDDGQQVKTGGVTLCTDSYKPEEIGFLRRALEINFNMITSIHNKKNPQDPESPYQRIYINKSSLEPMKEELKLHMHPSMLYKLNIKDETMGSNTELNSETNTMKTTEDFSDIGSASDID